MVFHGLACAEDSAIWSFARNNGYIIVTKDSDFNDMSTLHGAPPKIIWLRIGNCTTTMIETMLRRHVASIQHYANNLDGTILEIS